MSIKGLNPMMIRFSDDLDNNQTFLLPGSRRFQPPVEPSPWRDVKDALRFGPECYQSVYTTFRYNNSGEAWRMSEDCLFLNVYSPQNTNQVSAQIISLYFVLFFYSIKGPLPPAHQQTQKSTNY